MYKPELTVPNENIVHDFNQEGHYTKEYYAKFPDLLYPNRWDPNRPHVAHPMTIRVRMYRSGGVAGTWRWMTCISCQGKTKKIRRGDNPTRQEAEAAAEVAMLVCLDEYHDEEVIEVQGV